MSRPALRRRLAAASLACVLALGGLVLPAAARGSPPRLEVTGAILVEASTGRVLYAVDPNRRLPIASATKLMTALVTLEHEPTLGRVFRAPDYHPAAADSQIGLSPGEPMSVHDLLLGLLLPSGDDAAQDLAFNVGHGSVARFVGMMNAGARRLGLRHTHYTTPIGLDTPGNYSSPADLAKLARYLLSHSPFFARAVALPSAVLRTGYTVRRVVNRNDLVARFHWIDGVKTGHTLEAGYVLIGSGHRGGMTLISAVLGTPSERSRDDSTLSLLGYGFSNFRLVRPVRAGATIARPSVRYRPGEHVALLASRAFTSVERKGTTLRLRIKAPTVLAGPLPKGAVLGTLLVLAGARVQDRIPLILARTLPAVSPLTIAGRFVTRPLTLLLILLVLATGAGALVLRSRRGAHRATAGGTRGGGA